MSQKDMTGKSVEGSSKKNARLVINWKTGEECATFQGFKGQA